MKTKSKKHISLVLSTLILGSMGLVGCSSDNGGSSEPVVAPEKPAITKTISGIAVDGYIKLATVTLNGVTTQTNDTGIWSMAYTGDNSHVISVKGGIDTSTGKPFEGTLKAEIGEDGVNVAVTPLSTLVSSLVKNGETKAAASAKIATQLGISEATLAGDPIAILATGTTEQKAEAVQAIKSILTVQKATEAFAKCMGDAGSDNYEATFAGMYDVIAAQLGSAAASTTTVSAFDAVMANTSGITTALQTNLASIVTDPLMNDRLQAASSSVASVISSIHSISNADIANNRDSAAKAVEQLTTVIENKLVLISSSTTIAAIGTAQTNAAVVAEQNNIANLVSDYNANPDLDVTDSVVTPPVVDPVVPPVVDHVVPPVVDPVVPPVVDPVIPPVVDPVVPSVVDPVVPPVVDPVVPPVVDPVVPPVVDPVVPPVVDPVIPPVVDPVVPPVVDPVVPPVVDPVVPPVVDPVVPPIVTPVAPTPAATTATVAVTAANASAYNASSLGVTFNFTAGTYTYAVANFNDGDILNFPAGNNPTIINTNFADGNLTLQWANDGSVIIVNLSNIPTADDGSILGTTSFKTAFGVSSIQ
ncbi:MAG: hypothetical protein WC667_08240 [Sulfurimonas sp.]|jgi:hypothetical protein